MKVKMNTNVKRDADPEVGESEKNVYIYVRDRNKFSTCVNGVKLVLYLELIIVIAVLGFVTMLAFSYEPPYRTIEADLATPTKAFELTDSESDINLIAESTSTTESAISLTTVENTDDPGRLEKMSQLIDTDVDAEISHLQEAIKAFAENIEKAFNIEEQLSAANSEVSDVSSKSDETQSAEQVDENKSNAQEDLTIHTNDGKMSPEIPTCDPQTETLVVNFDGFKINYTCIKRSGLLQDSTEEKSTVPSSSDEYLSFMPRGWPYNNDGDYY